MTAIQNHFIIEETVEQICQQGCKKVYLCIERLEQAEDFAEISKLKQEEKQLVLEELRDIMRVYNGSLCSTS